MIGQSILAAFFYRKVVFPLYETLGEGLNRRSDGNLPPLFLSCSLNVDDNDEYINED